MSGCVVSSDAGPERARLASAQARAPAVTPSHPRMAAKVQATVRGKKADSSASPMSMPAVVPSTVRASRSSRRRPAMASPSVEPARTRSLMRQPPRSGDWRQCSSRSRRRSGGSMGRCSGSLAGGRAIPPCRPEGRTISIDEARSARKRPSSCRASLRSSTPMSISQLPSRLAALRLLDPMRLQTPSATAVFAWIMGPCHSNSRTPAFSRSRYPPRARLPTRGQLLWAGTRMRTSTPSLAAAASASATGRGAMK